MSDIAGHGDPVYAGLTGYGELTDTTLTGSGDAVLVASGGSASTGTLTRTFAALTVTAAGTSTLSGSLLRTLGPLSLSAFGQGPSAVMDITAYGEPVYSGLTGYGAPTDSTITAYGEPVLATVASSSGALAGTLATLTGSAQAVLAIQGQTARTLARSTLTAAGTLSGAGSGVLTATLDALTVTAAAVTSRAGSVDRTLAMLTVAAQGLNTTPIVSISRPTVTWSLLIDWNDSWLFDHPQSECGGLLFERFPLSLSTGKDYPSNLIGKVVAGQLTCTLDNRDRRFSSFNTASPLFGLVRPGRKVRLTALYDGVIYPVFQGILDDLKPVPDLNGADRAELRALGVLTAIDVDKVRIPIQQHIATNDAVHAVLDQIDWPVFERSVNLGESVMPYYWAGGIQGMTALREIEATEAGTLLETKEGEVAFRDRHWWIEGERLSSQAIYSDVRSVGLGYADIDQGQPYKETFGVISVELQQYQTTPVQPLWSLVDLPATLTPDERRTWWAQFPGPSVANAIAALSWEPPVAGVDYAANAEPDGSGADLAADLAITLDGFDTAAKITVHNTAGTVVYLTQLQARGVALVPLDPVRITAEDKTSPVYPREYPLDAKWIGTTAEAQARCDYELHARSDQLPVLTIGYIANMDPSHMVDALTRSIGDRVTVQSHKLGLDTDFFVEALHYTYTDTILRVALELSAAKAYGRFWALGVVGQSELDSSTVLAY